MITSTNSAGRSARGPWFRWRVWLDAWIFRGFDLSPYHLALCRILYASFNLIFLFDFRFDWLAELPRGFFSPPPGFPSAWVLWALCWLLLGLNILLLVGWQTRLVSISYSLVLMTLFSLVFSLGNIYHIILWVSTPLVMSFSGWGNRLSLDSRQRQCGRIRQWPISLLALLTGFAFFTAGLAKLGGGWLTPGSATWQHFMSVYHGVGRDQLLASSFASLHWAWFWEAADWFTVTWELGFLAAVWNRRMLRWFCWLAVFFHFGVLLILNISFSIHLVVFPLFADWKRLERAFPREFSGLVAAIDGLLTRTRPWMIGIAAACYLAAFSLQSEYSRVDGPTGFEFFVFGLAITYCLGSPFLPISVPRRHLQPEAGVS